MLLAVSNKAPCKLKYTSPASGCNGALKSKRNRLLDLLKLTLKHWRFNEEQSNTAKHTEI